MGNKQNHQIRSRLLIMGKLLASIYLIVFVTAQFTSSSGAYFTDSQEETYVLQAGTWWDGSELEYADNAIKISKEQNQKQTIEIELQNTGQSMADSTNYQVLFSEEGDPKKGNVVKKGRIAPLKSEESVTLSYETADAGVYMFKVVQSEGYEDNHDDSKDRFSDAITIKHSDMDKSDEEAKSEEPGSSDGDKTNEEAKAEDESNNDS